MTVSRTLLSPVLTLALVAVLILTGCDSTGPAADDADVAPDETAEMIAVSLAENNGGTADDLASASFYAQDVSTAGDAIAGKVASDSFTRDCSYSNADQVWTCDVSASRSTDRIDATFSRTVNVQFFDASGQVQRNYSVNGEPAASLSYTILSGTGTFTSPRVSSEHTLPASGASPAMWTVEDPDTDLLTINGSGSRSTDVEINGRRGIVTRSATITTQASDVVLSRGNGIQSGTVTGTYTADVLVTNDAGDEFTRTVDVTYEAVFTDGAVEVTFTGGGERFNGRMFAFSSSTGRPM